jgi:hypothetical protein
MDQNHPEYLTRLIEESFGPLFDTMSWAEDEIMTARMRYGDHTPGGGRLNDSFRLLKPNMSVRMPEVVYRAHCKELLWRVVTGEDTRRATNAEMLMVAHQASLATPMPLGAACLYYRLFKRALPELWKELLADHADIDAYETLHGDKADRWEGYLARKLYQEDRR